MTFEFGDVRVDVASRQVWKSGATVHLTRKAFELLTLLLEHQPNVMSKEQIHAHLWPDTFVSESSVQVLVSEIRQGVGNNPSHQSWIRTVHGIGYAFNGQSVPLPSAETASDVRGWLVADTWKVPLRNGENVLGRGGDDVTELDASTISRRHVRIEVGTEVWVEDLGSKNGTWVRDQRVNERTPLADGDSVRLGSLLFTFRLARGADTTDTQAATALS
jgi:DNA-binding winged helix-turn-helix (wHTH) protein